MSVKVLIERYVKAGKEEAVQLLLRDLRSQAVRQKGYMYGETWRSQDNPRIFMVVSTWSYLDHWEAWTNDEFRLGMEERIRPLLREPCVIRVFQESNGANPNGRWLP